jgi:hypothetical protein
VRGRVDQQQIGVFDRLEEILRRRPRREADAVRQPPILRCELDDVRLAFEIDDIAAQAALRHKRRVRRHLPRALHELPGPQPRRDKHGPHERVLVFRERRSAFEIRAQGIKGGHTCGEKGRAG